MPELEEYLRGFGLHQGLQLAGYTLSNLHGTHKSIVRYKEYEYDIEMTFTPQSSNNSNALLSALKNLTAGSKIINSRYGNPYKCDFGSPHIESVESNGDVFITTVGHSYRV